MTISELDDVSRVASPRAVVPASWATAAILRRRPGAARIAVATSTAWLVTQVLKHLVPERRPRLLDRTPEQSFPSGHSATATAYLTSLALVAPSAYRPLAVAAACVGILAVNVARVRAREHWVTDVLVGDLVGAIGVAAAHGVVRAHGRRLRRPVERP